MEHVSTPFKTPFSITSTFFIIHIICSLLFFQHLTIKADDHPLQVVNLPDLTVQIDYAFPVVVNQGNVLEVEGIVQNIGTGSTDASGPASIIIDYYLSADQNFSPATDIYLNGVPYPNTTVLAPGEFLIEQLNLPTNSIPFGIYYLILVVDPLGGGTPLGIIPESNENNNVFVYGTQITVGIDEDLDGPDLICEIDFVEKTDLEKETKFNVTSTTVNLGTSDASDFFTRFYLSKDSKFRVGEDFFIGGEQFNPSIIFASGDSVTADEELDISKGQSVVPDGDYFLICVADAPEKDFPIGQITEADENNNQFIYDIKIRVKNGNLPDLIPKIEFVEDKPVYTPTDVFDSNARTTNQGTADALNFIDNEGFFTKFFLSKDILYDPDDFEVGGDQFGPDSIFTPGRTSVRDEKLAINKDGITVPEGEYYLILVTDPWTSELPNGRIIESDENNNEVVYEKKIIVQNPAPDLIIQDANAAVPAILPGIIFSLTFDVKNNGNSSANETNVCIYLSKDNVIDVLDIPLGELDIPTTNNLLGPGEIDQINRDISIPLLTLPGAYQIIIEADCDKVILESDETNNLGFVPLEVLPQSDLTITDLSLTPASLAPGGSVELGVTYVNQGDADAGLTALCFYLSDDELLDEDDLLLGNENASAVLAGQSLGLISTQFIPNPYIPGNYFLLAQADCDEVENESNETNNVVAKPIVITQNLPDLFITNEFVDPPTFQPGDSIKVSFTINSIGTGDAPVSQVCVYISNDNVLDADDGLITNVDIPALQSGDFLELSSIVPISELATPGDFFVIFKANCDSGFIESDSGNNEVSVAITIDPLLPNLTTIAPSLLIDTVFPGDTTTLEYSLSNQGPGDAAATSLCFYLSTDSILNNGNANILLDELPLQALTARSGATLLQDLVIPVGTTPGDYFVVVQIDCQNLVAETNETDNAVAAAITVQQPLPDLSVANPTIANPIVTPKNVLPGEEVDLSVQISNVGNADANISTTCLTLSLDNILDPTDILVAELPTRSIAAGELFGLNEKFTIPQGTAPGNYWVIIEVDCKNGLNESDETNNIILINLTVDPPLPDLSVADPTIANPIVTPKNVLPGEEVDLSVQISNVGNTGANISTTCLTLSLDNILDPVDIPVGELPTGAITAGELFGLNGKFTVPQGIAPGNYWVIIEVDCKNELTEIDETNNIILINLTVDPPLPDLTITSPFISQTTFLPGDTIFATFSVENLGDVPTSTVCIYLSTNNGFDDDDPLLAQITVPSLLDNDFIDLSALLSISPNTLPGDYFILFQADCGFDITESDETNNDTVIPVTINPLLPNLIVENPALTPNTLFPGDTISIDYEVFNRGQSESGMNALCFYLSPDNQLDTGTDILLFQRPLDFLSAGVGGPLNQKVPIPPGTVAGNYFVIIKVDCEDVVTESDETDNITFAPININPPLSDLTFSGETITPNTVFPGDVTTASFELGNFGLGDAANSTVCFILSTDEFF